MRKVTILGLIALLVGVLAYFALFYVTPDERAELSTVEQSVEEEQGTEEEVEAEPRSGVGTLDFVRQWGEDVECTIIYTPDDQNTPTEGTYFVSGGDIRGDFMTDSPDLTGQVLSSMIIDDSMMYMWSEIDGEAYGMKMDLSDVKDSEMNSNTPVSLDDDVRYVCKPWPNIDRTVFVPPGDVLFQDLGAIMKTGIEEGILYEEGELPF